jgi:uncharacterized protein DUF6916
MLAACVPTIENSVDVAWSARLEKGKRPFPHMLKLDQAKAADFSKLLHSRFRLSADKRSHELELVEAKASGPKRAKGKGRSPFSLLFKAPPGKHLPQQTYKIEHDKLGAMDLFIVPVRADKSGCYYEAIFN